MIEINLSPRQKENLLANLGGLNLSLINVKFVIASIIMLYGIEPFVLDYYDGLSAEITAKLNDVRKEQRKISTALQELKDVKKQVEDLNRQETALSKRVSVVKEIVDKRQNPFKVLKYIAENTPPDVWVTELSLEERRFSMTGFSKSWKSISDFLTNLNSSVFFNQGVNQSMNYTRTQGAQATIEGTRVEPFTVNANIVSFE